MNFMEEMKSAKTIHKKRLSDEKETKRRHKEKKLKPKSHAT